MNTFYKIILVNICLLFLSTAAVKGQNSDMQKDSIYAFHKVDIPAIFPGCDQSDDIQRRICSNEAIDKYVSHNLEFPATAKSHGTQGKCVVQYTVNKSGYMEDLELVRDIGDDCGAEALRILTKMQADSTHWQPALLDGEIVAVQMKTVVDFFLGHKMIFTPRNNKGQKAKNKAAQLEPN